MSTNFTNGWLYDWNDNHFAPKSFMSLIYDETTGRTLPKYIKDEIYDKPFVIDVSHSNLQTFGEMAEDSGWPGIVGALQNGIAYGTNTGCSAFLATPSEITKFSMSSSSGAPVFSTVTLTSTQDATDQKVRLHYGTATDDDSVITSCVLGYASKDSVGIVSRDTQSFKGDKTFIDKVIFNDEVTLDGGLTYTLGINGKIFNGSQDVNVGIIGTAYGGTGNGNGRIQVGQISGTQVHSGATSEGYDTNASGSYSHAEGYLTEASGAYSHAQGFATIASGQ
jgi:hypothetical protein